jgi:integrase
MSPPDLLRSAQEYVALRRALGFRMDHETWYLPDFVAFLAEHGSAVITTELALRWAQRRPGTSPGSWASRLDSVRGFAKHHRAIDPRTEVPPRDLVSWRPRRQEPHIYTDEEVSALMREARRLTWPLQGATYSTVIGLLAATGMRLGELVALEDGDVDWARSLLVVRHAKFQKSRLVPVHPSTLAALRRYRIARDRQFPRRRGPSFFVSCIATRLRNQRLGHVFIRLLRLTGIDRSPGRRPRLHDLRHTFAVTTLRDWYRAGLDVERRLPSLSTYLGHVSPSSTYWYLTATPELLALAGKRLARSWEARP